LSSKFGVQKYRKSLLESFGILSCLLKSNLKEVKDKDWKGRNKISFFTNDRVIYNNR
jgi:hypothetical protein